MDSVTVAPGAYRPQSYTLYSGARSRALLVCCLSLPWKNVIPSAVGDQLRHAARSLLRRPVLSVVALVTLGLGTGANTANCLIINVVLLKPLPFKDPDRLVMAWSTAPTQGLSEGFASYPDFHDWQDNRKFPPCIRHSRALGEFRLSLSQRRPVRPAPVSRSRWLCSGKLRTPVDAGAHGVLAYWRMTVTGSMRAARLAGM